METQTDELAGVTTLDDIRAAAKSYADAREILTLRVGNLNKEVESAKRRLLPGIRNAVRLAQDAKAVVEGLVAQAQGLFVRPRTQVCHGIKLGLLKKKDRLVWDNDEALVKAIRRYLPDQADVLVRTVEAPVRDALSELSISELKRLGVRVHQGGDGVVVRPVDSDVDKLVAALLKDSDSATLEDGSHDK